MRSAFRRAGAANAAQVRTLCLAQGVPNLVIDSFQYANQQVQSSTGGNPNLQEETADTYSYGLVFNPHFDMPLFERVSASVDYYNIKIENAVGTHRRSHLDQELLQQPAGRGNQSVVRQFERLLRPDPS